MMMKKMTMLVMPALALILTAPAAAPAGLINGSFEQFSGGSNGVASQLGTSTSGTGYSVLNGWTLGSGTYGFLMAPGSADTTGSYSPQYSNTFKIWGSKDGGLNTIAASSPDGGNFLALDGGSDYRGAGISQTLTGLTVGKQYAVSFDWAGAQQYGYTGDTYEGFQVNFGSQAAQYTSAAHNASMGYTDWAKTSMVFTADATSDTLTFLALGTPGGEPPIVMLDGVSFNAVPEPASLALVGCGLAGVTAFGRIRRGKAPAA